MGLLTQKSNHPIIVIEGPDGTGKTTLSDALREELGARYIHLTYRWKDKMHLYHLAALRTAAILAKTSPVVIDRWWPSEIAYADAYRGGSKYAKYFMRLDYAATQMGVFYVMCLPSDRERYLKHYNVLKGKRTEMYDEGMERVYDNFLEIWRWTFKYRPNAYRYDFFESYESDSHSREMVLRNTCQKVLEMTEDHRSTL
jgi:DNA polymerase III delta prime subunit